MKIDIRDPQAVRPSEITPESVYRRRRDVLGLGGGLLAGAGLGVAGVGVAGLLAPGSTVAASAEPTWRPADEAADTPPWLREKIAARHASLSPLAESVTPYRDVTRYNNFYEFGTDKTDPAQFEHQFKPHPWTVDISGEIERPGRYQLEDFLKPYQLEDRVYRFRCVEAWSMVIPWLGFPLRQLIDTVKPRSSAKYLAFTTLQDPERFPGQRRAWLDWPYVEGLRLDEAMHPLTLMAVGVYGRSLPAQNGAPLRLVVPWKYGFKSIKSIVKIAFVEKPPVTTWNTMASDEYGFYANVNPAVDHPRWSQARERRLPNTLFNPNWQPTLPFNGYATEVASLYSGMDLGRYF